MPVLMKIHKTHQGIMIGICDSDLLELKFEEDEMILDITKHFFGGKPTTLPSIIKALKGCITANIIGNKIIGILIKKGILNERNVKTIQNVKYAHLYRI